jgi:NADH-quinone oxidoreductase subunit L
MAFGELTGQVVIPVIGFLVAGVTAFYMFRLVIRTFLGEHAEPQRLAHIHESPAVMTIPLVVLAVMSFFAVFSLNPLAATSGWIVQSLPRPEFVTPVSVAPATTTVFEEALHQVHTNAMGLSLLMAGLGILVAFATYAWKKIDAEAVARRLRPLYLFLLNKWYFDETYDLLVIRPTLGFTRLLRWFDNTIVDGVVNGAGWLTRGFSFVSGRVDTIVVDGAVNMTAYLTGVLGLVLRKFQTGKVQTYIMFVVLSVVIFYFVYRLV